MACPGCTRACLGVLWPRIWTQRSPLAQVLAVATPVSEPCVLDSGAAVFSVEPRVAVMKRRADLEVQMCRGMSQLRVEHLVLGAVELYAPLCSPEFASV